jgi:hypothetical protein
MILTLLNYVMVRFSRRVSGPERSVPGLRPAPPPTGSSEENKEGKKEKEEGRGIDRIDFPVFYEKEPADKYVGARCYLCRAVSATPGPTSPHQETRVTCPLIRFARCRRSEAYKVILEVILSVVIPELVGYPRRRISSACSGFSVAAWVRVSLAFV